MLLHELRITVESNDYRFTFQGEYLRQSFWWKRHFFLIPYLLAIVAYRPNRLANRSHRDR